MGKDILELIEKLEIENNCSDEDLLFILDHMDAESEALLFERALKVKKEHYGLDVFMRGLIEFTNYCKQNCMYCGIRSGNQEADRYRLSKESILECCLEGYQLGYRTFVLQGGEDPWYTDERLVDIVKTIKTNWKDVAVTLSVGERSYESYVALFKAGADRYLLRHETASPEVYKAIHPGMSFENRIQCLRNLKKIGFQVGAGFMVGLPEQGNKELVMDLRFLKELEPEMVGIGPFIPHKKTPLGEEKGGSVEKTLIMVALVRLLLPKALLPSTTALGTMDPQGREKALKAGANVVMPNLSPTDQREKYELYENKICTGDEAAHCRVCIEGRIKSAGFHVNMGRGDHEDWCN